MTFASTLNEYYDELGCTNKDISSLCNVSSSTLSRYRNGKRTPEPQSEIVSGLASAFAELFRKSGALAPPQESTIREQLESSITGSRMAGMDFNMRLDALMQLARMRNAKMAEATMVDPSYISRIRKGTRKPADLDSFTDSASRILAQTCLEKGLASEVCKLVGDVDFATEAARHGFDENSNLAEAIEKWLLGDKVVEADVAELERLFAWLDATDFSDWLAMGDEPSAGQPAEPISPARTARFYYGVDGMKSAETDFLSMAAETHSRNLSLSSDMPLLQMELDQAFIAKYKRGIGKLLESGCHINIVHGVERSLEETIQAMRLWIPFYMTGRVSPYYLKGIHNRLFCHVNYVCDTCALSSEAMIGHQEDGRYFFSTRPADVAYYQKKMGFILERSTQMFALYRNSDPDQRKAFEQAEEARWARGRGRPIGEGRYERLSVTSHAADCVVVSLQCSSDVVHFVISHPKINYAATRMK